MSDRSPRQPSGRPLPRHDAITFEVSISLASFPLDIIRSLLSSLAGARSAGPGEPVEIRPADAIPGGDLQRLRSTLKSLEQLPLAAILRELGAVLHNRDIRQWSVLTDISDELLDEAARLPRARMAARAFPDRVTDSVTSNGTSAPERAALRARRRSRRR